ncbi:MAG: hypothetical protein ACO2PO_05945 [Candidatus Calescibacterium sp.]
MKIEIKFLEKVFLRYFDFFVALFSALLINIITFYFFVKYHEPIYFHADELRWLKLLSFCGGEFAFYEQRWGIIVPLLCLVYPLKFVIPLYYFGLLRLVFIFFDMYLLLKVLGFIFSRKVALIIFFFIYSPIFSLLKFILGVEGMGIVQNAIHGGPMRIFNPVFFMIFFLLFLYYFLRFLDGVERWENDPEKWRKEKLLSGIFWGLSFYSHIYWAIYTFSIFMFFVLILRFLGNKWSKLRREIMWILLLGVTIGVPGILFNFYQRELIGETVERTLILKVERNIELLRDAFKPEYLFLFLLAFLSFVLRWKFTPKYIFIFSCFFGGYLLFFVEYILGVYMQISGHVIVPFKIMAKVGIGLLFERIEEVVREFKIKILRFFIDIVLVLMFFAFVSSSLIVFYYSTSYFYASYDKLENFRGVVNWIKENTSDDSVITCEDSLVYSPLVAVGGISELVLSLATNRFILYNQINYFSDLRHEDIFDRFILRAKLLGFSEDDLKKYVYDIIEHHYHGCLVVYSGLVDFCAAFPLIFFGGPKDFKFPRDKYEQEVIDDFVEVALRYYQDERYFEDLLRKYRVDYVVRKKPYQEEWYLREETKIGEFYIFRVIKEKE